MGRPSLHASRMRKRRANETENDKNERLESDRKRNTARRLGETSKKRVERLSRMRNYVNSKLRNETVEQREHRMSLVQERLSNETADQRDHRMSVIQERLSNETAEQREHRMSLIQERLSNETAEQREHRMSLIQERLSNETAEQREHRMSVIQERLSNETTEQREHRLSLARCQSTQSLHSETLEERAIRLSDLQARNNRRLASVEHFKSLINVFADVSCNICKKMIYPQQRTVLQTTSFENLLPADLIASGNIVACTRCSNNIKKRKIPAQAYWNKMIASDIPEEIANLTEIEKRFLLRIVPFLQMIRVQNRFSQDWCKGQVILFAKDIIELAEQLPLQPHQAGLVIITENLENLHRSREFQVDMVKLNLALQWLLENNVLYRDVRPSFSNIIDLSVVTQIAEAPVNVHSKSLTEQRHVNSYTSIDENVAILQGSFHQGSERFSPESRGKQCTAIATIACTAFSLVDPNTWCRSDVDYIVILGDRYYRECIVARVNPDNRELNYEYLAVTELLPRIIYNRQAVNLSVNYEAAYNGHIDNDNSSEGFPSLKIALFRFFEASKYGLLTSNAITVAVHCRNQSETSTFWLFDSHARGAKGCRASVRGTSCCMRFYNINQLYYILRRNLYIHPKDQTISTESIMLNVYSLTPIMISTEIEQTEHQPDSQPIIEDLSQSTQDLMPLPPANVHADSLIEQRHVNTYTSIDENVAILQGSFHQGSEQFSPESRGKQCTAIATIACTAFSLLDPNTWCRSDVDYIVKLGDKYYRECIVARVNPDNRELNYEYLAVTELLPRIIYNRQAVNLSVNYEAAYNGHIDNDNSSEGFPNLKSALFRFFETNKYGILTSNAITVSVHCRNQSETCTFWLFDSHARGADGCKASIRGTACCMRFYNIDQLYYILRQNLYIPPKDKTISTESIMLNVYSLTPIMISTEIEQTEHQLDRQPIIEDLSQSTQDPMPLPHHQSDNHPISPQVHGDTNDSVTRYVYTTSMLHTIDEGVPDLGNVVSAYNNDLEKEVRLAEITRKTAPPLNLERERRMEELGWYFLFPDGKNGFGERRDIPITALDYFQARVMGSEARFQRNDYLFFALSVVEYFRAKSSVSVSCRMRQGYGERTPEGLVENIHLTMRNVRGSASYWRRCCSELIAMVRSLGAPTWFMTFSCNDLNWPDMTKALLIADGRDLRNAEALSFLERLQLVQKYPVVVARQFTIRVNALLRYLKNNNTCLGGSVQDYWYRIEFQNRGSPHLHMLLWCDGIPDFSTTEGIAAIERVVSCSLSSDDPYLRNLVENVQIHKHTATCHKDRSDSCCRFGYPKAPADSTTCLGNDEALSNNGRFCILKRAANETMVNNYNPELLSLWEANMDIQPCGNVTAVAYYVAKYASKCEPHDTGEVVREAITKAKRSGGAIWNQLFAVSMAILSKRLVSAPECAYRLCHLPLKMSSRKAVFVNSCKPEQRFRLLRFDGDETAIYNNIFDRYVLRPDQLEGISLAEFAVRYETVSSTTWTEDDGDIEMRDLDNQPLRYIKLRDNTRMRIRNKPAVLRTRYYTINSDKEAYYYSLLVCHIPFRNENQLLLEGESAEECFLRRQGELRPLLNNVSSEEFAHAEQVIQQALAQAAALNALRDTRTNSTRDEPVVCADEHIIYDQDDYCDDLENRAAMSDDIFFGNIRGLNLQQKNLFQKITQSIQNNLDGDNEKLLLFITGGAGSGKSFVLKLLVEHIKRCYAPTVDVLLNPTFVEVTSLTGVAARQIFGKTLHSVFHLPIEKGNARAYTRMTGHKLEQERRKWRYIDWLIIDEISMVSYENLRMIHLRLQEFKNNELIFGGINILLFGDIMQLPPVKGNWCFVQPVWCSAEVNLWHQFSFCELTINMRQQNDHDFIDLLNHLRFGELTTVELELLCERRRVPLTGEFEDGAVVRIYPTVKQVDEYNSKMTAANAEKNRTYKIHAIDESREAATYGRRPPDNVIPNDVNNCGGLLPTILLAVESRVMLRRNIAVSDGLVNGAMGVVKRFKWPALRRDQLEEGEMPDAVLIKFDDESIGSRLKDADGYVSIPPMCATFQATKGYGDVERRMLPLILCWAVTVHKLQGTTHDKAVIDLGKKNFAKGQIYVALSRVKTLEGIALSDLEPSKLLNKPHDERALAEMQRLRNFISDRT